MEKYFYCILTQFANNLKNFTFATFNQKLNNGHF